MKHVGIEIKFYNLDTFKKQIDVNFIDLDSNLVDLNYKVASLIFSHFWRSIVATGPGPQQIEVTSLACEQALLFGQAKRASRERVSEGLRKG